MRVASAGMPDDAKRQASVEAIERLLKTARAATQQRRWLHWRGIFDRWRGTSVGRAYQSLHAAEIFLVDLLPDEEIDALIPRILVRDTTDVDGDDPRRAQIDQLLKATPKSKRAAVKSALTYSYDVSDQAYVRVRDFRNVILVSTALVTVLMFAFVILVGLHPSTSRSASHQDRRPPRPTPPVLRPPCVPAGNLHPPRRTFGSSPAWGCSAEPVGRILHPEHPRYVPPLRNPDRIVPAEGAERRADGGSSDPLAGWRLHPWPVGAGLSATDPGLCPGLRLCPADRDPPARPAGARHPRERAKQGTGSGRVPPNLRGPRSSRRPGAFAKQTGRCRWCRPLEVHQPPRRVQVLSADEVIDLEPAGYRRRAR